MSFGKKNVRILAGLIGLSSLTPLSAQAIQCSEYLNTAGRPTLTAEVSELLPNEIQALTKPRVLVSAKPRVRQTGDQIVARFDNLPVNEAQIIGIQSKRPYRRPDFHEVEGFMADLKKRAVEKVSTEAEGVPKPHLTSQIRTLAYGMIPGGKTLMVRLRSDEVIAAVTRIDETKRLVATIREERTIGFHPSSGGAGRTFLVELYHFEGTGYSVSGLRIPATAEFPIIKISTQEEKGLLLSVGEQDYQIHLKTTGDGTNSSIRR